MAGNILTPTAIWKNFNIPFIPSEEVVRTSVDGKFRTQCMYIQGQVGGDEQTKIYATLTQPNKKGKLPAILILQDLDSGYDQKLVAAFAELGYVVLSVDVAGYKEDAEFYTVYPQTLSYANYETSKDKLCEVEDEATKTCWYEWTRVTRYALKYLISQPFVSRVGGFASGDVATALWQTAGTTDEIACSVFVLNAGWRGYRGINKFGGNVEPQFSDNMYKFIAGIEPQAYAMHIKSPALMLSATNSDDYDCDRATDTLSRIAEGAFTAVHYSVGYRERVSGEAFKDATIFFDEFLKKETSDFNAKADIVCEIVEGVIKVDVTVDANIKGVELYASEEIAEPSKRCWQKVTGGKKDEDKYTFNYQPYQKSQQANFFALATYKNGFVAGTKIINKKFTDTEVLSTHKSKILYSSRIDGCESVFSDASLDKENQAKINLKDKKLVIVKKGPMSIEGVGCKWGLLTFKVCAQKDMPANDAILMFDVYAVEAGILQVKLITDYFGAKTEYVEKVKLVGGDIWQNVKIAINRYKTAEGKNLKSYEKIEALEFTCEGEFLLNNALWV